MRHSGLLECAVVRERHVRTTDAHHGAVEVVEAVLLDRADDLGAEAAGAPRLLDDAGAIRLAYGGEHRVEVERTEAAEIDDVGLHAPLSECFGGFQGDVDRA